MIVERLRMIDTENTAPEGMPASDETRAAFRWLLDTAEYNAGAGEFVFDVTMPGAPVAVRFTAQLEVIDA